MSVFFVRLLRRTSPCAVLLVISLLQAQGVAAAGAFPPVGEEFGGRPLAAAQASPGTQAKQREPDAQPENLALRNGLVIGTTAGLFALYGKSKWWDSGFGDGFKTTKEGWFGAGTRYGGIDKLGHMYSNYASMRLLTPLFESVGNSHDASVWLAAFTTTGIFTGVEVIDGFSRKWKFSPEDAVMNVVGTVLGAALETNPELDRVLDFRVDYRRSSSSRFDPFGDYSGQKYLLVVKADGFAPLRRSPFLRYLELGVGYGARGFDPGQERRRDAYVGVSINLARLLADGAYGGEMHSTRFQRATDRLFDLVQFPTIGYVRHSLD